MLILRWGFQVFLTLCFLAVSVYMCRICICICLDRGWADVHLNPPLALHASAHMQSLLCSQQSWPLLVQLVQLVLLVQLVHSVKNNYAIYLQEYSE